jgi:TonB family protein
MRKINFRSYTFRTFLALCFLAFNLTSAAQDSASLLTRAAEVTNIRKEGMPPFRMRAKIIVSGDKTYSGEGTFELLWASPSQWREELHLPGYSRLRIGGNNKFWEQRNTPYEILRVNQLDQMLNISSKLRLRPQEQLGKQENKKEAGVTRGCLEISYRGAGNKLLCFDPASGGLSLEDNSSRSGSGPIIGVSGAEYSDFHDRNGHSYPYLMIAHSGKAVALEFQVEALASLETTDASLFNPPDGAEEWDSCDYPTPPEALLRPQPEYPAEARKNHEEGTVVVYAVIDRGGAATRLRVVNSASPALDQAALAAISQWRYAPAACNGNPIRLETVVESNFFLR